MTHDPLALTVGGLAATQKSVTIGFDTSNPDSQPICPAPARADLNAKVQGYPPSEIYGWIHNASAAPQIYTESVRPDAPSPCHWGLISFDADGGIDDLSCSSQVAQQWLKGVEQAHAVSNPNSLRMPALSVG